MSAYSSLTLFLPISFVLSSLSHSYGIIPINSQLFHSYHLYPMLHSEFSYLLDSFPAPLFQFLDGSVSYFSNSAPLISLVSYIPTVKFLNFSFLSVSLLLPFQFSSFLSIVSEFPYRFLFLGILFKM